MTRRRRQTYDVQEFAAFARRIMRAMGRRAAAGEMEPADLSDLFALRAELDTAITAAVVACHAQGFSWAEIGSATGTTRQRAHARWGQAARDTQKAVNESLTAEKPWSDGVER